VDEPTLGVKEILARVYTDEVQERDWRKWRNHKDPRIAWEAFKLSQSYLHGKPVQPVVGVEECSADLDQRERDPVAPCSRRLKRSGSFVVGVLIAKFFSMGPRSPDCMRNLPNFLKLSAFFLRYRATSSAKLPTCSLVRLAHESSKRH
jgi:hypothetical protein